MNAAKHALDTETPDWDDTRYFADPAIDQSQIKAYIKNPAQWAYDRLNPAERKTTPQQAFGTAFHAYILETAEVIPMPEGMSLRKKDDKAWYDQQISEGRIVVKHDDMEMLQRMKQALTDSPELYDHVRNGYPEQAILWTDPATGIRLKAKPDLIPVNVPWFVDLKTARSSDETDFAKEAYRWGYAMQACFYSAAIAAVEPKKFGRTRRMPSGCQFWVWGKNDTYGDFRRYSISKSNAMYKNAAKQLRQALTRIADDVLNGEEAGLGNGLDAAARWCLANRRHRKTNEELEFPAWLIREAEDDLTLPDDESYAEEA